MKLGYRFVDGKYEKKADTTKKEANWNRESETEEKLEPKDKRTIQIGSNIQFDPKQYDLQCGESLCDEVNNAYLRDNRLDITEKEAIAKVRNKRYQNKVENAIREAEEKEDEEYSKKFRKKFKETVKLD